MEIIKNYEIVIFLIILYYNFSASQERCREYKNSDNNPPDQIYLLESSDPQHRIINDRFISENGGYPKTLVTECQLKMEDIIRYSKQFSYLINLYVPDFYKNNYNKIRESLVFAGDIDDSETKVNVCKSANTGEDGIEKCDFFIDEGKKYAKLSSGQIEENYKEIFNNILEFQPNKFKNRVKNQLNVKVCDKTIDDYYYDAFIIENLINCNDDNPSFLESVKDNTLAVLALKVFNIIRPIENLVVFYGEPYITKATKDWFKNSMTAVPWQSLKYGFLFFIMKMKWMRVVIISDSSEFSQEFEAVLTKLFHDNAIAYMTETCVTSNCSKVINKIDEKGAKIIIANFELAIMEKIAKYAKLKKLVSARNVIWVTRGLHNKEAKEAADMLHSEIFNISFKENLNYILQILNTIRYRIQVNCVTTEPCSFSKSDAAAHLKESLKRSEIEITSITNDVQKHIGYIVVEDEKITEEIFNYPYNDHIEDSFIQCTFWNNSFEKPCSDTELILLMVILCVFCLTLLGVVLFFQSPELEMSYRRMP